MTDNAFENNNTSTVDMTSDVTENSTSNIQPGENVKEEKMFTQSQLEEIIRERIQRERKVNDSLSAVKKLLKSACDKGLINGVSYAEMAKDLVERLGNASSRKETSEGINKSHADDETPAVADVGGKEDVCNADGKENGEKEKCADMSFFGILSDIKSKYPLAEVEKMLTGNGFERFSKGRSGDVRKIFDDYYEFMSAISEEQSGSMGDKCHSELCSTAFSSHSGASDAGANLTRQQMEIAKSAGMSYREYQNLLESIPKRSGRTF